MQIEECDQILGAMETMLGKFQADLGNVSGEIRSLQVQALLTEISGRAAAAKGILTAACAHGFRLALAITSPRAQQVSRMS